FVSQGPDPSGWLAAISVYFLFLALTGLRLSPRLCMFMGVAEAVEFLLLGLVAQALGGPALPIPQQATVAVLMVASGFVLAFSAHNAQQLVIRMGQVERERAHLEGVAEATRRLAITDELTGLHNRRHFQDELRAQMLHTKAHHRTLTILMIDVDRFKEINDALGHQAGDQTLNQLASVLGRHARSADLVARVGGDEFAVLLYGADFATGKVIAERLCEAVRNEIFDAVRDLAELRPTLSIGLACFPIHARDAEELLVAADKALYAAKKAGRDRVAEATPETTKAFL
ncbi:MAG: GGDEF domain-containing protein, partial [Chloroflexi bacterium]|nr:GGDEF domain-containing protein [Chloroflexota bacterium]